MYMYTCRLCNCDLQIHCYCYFGTFLNGHYSRSQYRGQRSQYRGLRGLNTEVRGLNTEVSEVRGLNTEVRGLNTEVSEVRGLNTEVSEVRGLSFAVVIINYQANLSYLKNTFVIPFVV